MEVMQAQIMFSFRNNVQVRTATAHYTSMLFWAGVYMYCSRGAWQSISLGYLTCIRHLDLESSQCNI
jgi:hypothetical protein